MRLREHISSIISEYLAEQDNNNYSDTILYHGTNSDFNNFDVGKSGLVHYSDWGNGIYFTTSKSQAHNYRVDAVKNLDKEYNDAYDDYIKTEKMFKSAKPETEEKSMLYNLLDKKLKAFQQVGRELNSTKDGRLVTAKIKSGAKIYKYNSYGGLTDRYLADTVKSKGYDIILVDEGRYTEEFVVLNPDSIIITGEIKDN